MPISNENEWDKFYVSDNYNGTISIVDGLSNNIINTLSIGDGIGELIQTKENLILAADPLNNLIYSIDITGNILKFNIANNGFIDIDSNSGKLYVGKGKEISIYNISNGKIIDNISGFTSTGYLKLSHLKKLLYVLDNNTLKIYNTSSLNLLATIEVGLSPSYILIDKEEKMAYISSSDSSTISVINLFDYIVIQTINLSNTQPKGLELLSNTLYVADGIDSVIPINTLNGVVGSPITVGKRPLRLKLSSDKLKLYVTNNQSGNITIIDTLTNKSIENIFGFNSPYDIVGGYNSMNSDTSSNLTDNYEMADITEPISICAKKVFAHYQKRESFSNILLDLPSSEENYVIERFYFKKGIIEPNSLIITPVPERPNFSRAQFLIKINYTVEYRDGEGVLKSISSFLPSIEKDIVVFMPRSRDEFNFDIVIETRTDVLNTPLLARNTIKFAVGIFIVIKVIGEVEILIPTFGYSPAPPPCEDYQEDIEPDLCQIFNDFNQTPFPEDFFPPAYEDLKLNNK